MTGFEKTANAISVIQFLYMMVLLKEYLGIG
jgi:hypothetical protein